MQTSNYLIRALFYQLNHGTVQCLESRSEALFQRPGRKSFIEVHHQQPGQQGLPNSGVVLDDQQESDCSSVHPSLLGESRCVSSDEDLPPIYDNSPGLLRQDILELEDLQQIETVSALMAALSIRAYTHSDEENQALFPSMVSESSKSSNRVSF